MERACGFTSAWTSLMYSPVNEMVPDIGVTDRCEDVAQADSNSNIARAKKENR